MLDIKFIRENQNLIKEAIRKKHINFDLEKFLKIDEERKNILQEVEELRAKQRIAGERIPKLSDESEKKSTLEILRDIKDRLSHREYELNKRDAEWKRLMLQIPNVPDPSVPEGDSDADNQEIRTWGKLKFNFEPKNHISLMKNLGMVDFERGAKVAGFRGYFLKNDAVLLSLALWRFAFESLINKGFIPFFAPSMARPENFIGTGWLPQGEEEIYKTQDNLYFAGTAEVAMMGFHADEIISEKDLPLKYVAFSPCFRREAGSYGKDTKGVFRIHEFFKVEQVILCKAEHQESVKWHEEITKNSEELMRSLNIPYRVVVNCGGDLGLGQVKKYDIEAWLPSEKKYRETHSSSYFHDFQTRRLGIRYRDSDGRLHFAHSLNNTAIATPRILIPFLENHQQEDGSIKIPEALRKYFNKETINPLF
jgi:seryl-tRNA synthetase